MPRRLGAGVGVYPPGGVVAPGGAMHGPQLGPHVGQRSREDVSPGRGRQTLLWVKGIRLAPQTGSLSVQVGFLRVWPLWSDCWQPGQQAVPSRARTRDKDQKATERRRWRLPGRVPSSHPLPLIGNSRLGPLVPPRVAAQSPGPPPPCLTITHSLSSHPLVPTSAIAVSPSPLLGRPSPPFCPENARGLWSL